MITHGLAALYQIDAFQSCVGQVARASHDLYRVWSFQRQYAGREDQLIAVCESWHTERAPRPLRGRPR